MSKKTIGIFAAIAMVLSLVGANVASALTAGDIAMLQAAGIISAAQAASLNATIASPVAASSGYTFAKDLTVGSRGADVTALQNMLGISPATGYFGALTKAAVIKFQQAKGITPAAGYFGPKTRAIASGAAVSGTTGTVISGTDLSVSLSATSPLASALVAGQAAADLAEFTFTNKSAAPAIVTNVTLQRMGVSADSALTNVYLFNGATRLTDAASVSAGKITFNAASGIFTVPAGSSIVVSVKADIAAGTNGQLIAIALTGVTASLPVSAVYPVSGSSMSIFSSGDIAQATSTLASGLSGNITAGSLNQTIWSTSLSLSGRSVYLKSLALKVIGSIPQNSLQNIQLYVTGIPVAKAMGMDANGMVTFDLTAAPYKIDSSRTLEVRADVVNGSSRTFSVSLQNPSDLQIVDSNYNVGITVGLAAGSSWSSGTYTVTTGSVTVTLDPSLAAGNVVTGASNVALARYTAKAYGEDMKISYISASSSKQLDNVSLYANGIQIGSTQTISATGTNTKLYSLGSSLIIPAGQTVTIEIRGDIKYNGVNATTTNNIIKVALIGYANNAQGSYSSQLSTVPANGIEGPAMTVVGAGLTVAKKSGVNTISVPNKTGVKIGSYVLQANSSEDIKVTGLTVNLGGTISATTSLANLYVVVDGVAQTPINPSASNNFQNFNLTVPANGTKIVDVYADIQNTSGTATTSLSVTGYGVGSNITISSSAVIGQTISVGAGTLATPTLDDSSSAKAQFVVGGTTTSVPPLANYNFVSSNGDSTITDMDWVVTGPITSLTVGGKIVTVVGGLASSSGLSIVIPAGYGGAKVPVTATFDNIGYGYSASAQSAYVTLKGYKYTSGNTNAATTTLTVSSKTMVVVSSKPASVTLNNPDTVNGVRTGSSVKIASVTITPDTAGPIGLVNLPLSIVTSEGASTTGATLTVKVGGTTITGTTGGVASVPASGSATGTIVFSGSNGYSITQSTTFDVYANITLAPTANVSNPSISTTLGDSSFFVWSDINGAATSTGAYIVNYPATSATINY